MKVSVNWLKQFTDVNRPVDELVTKIGAQLGAVEEVVNLGEKYQGIVVVKVVECRMHEDADKLKVCLIDDGGKNKQVKREKGLIQVVCGASNVRPNMLAAWLSPGSTVPATFDKEPLTLTNREIRGVLSNGMLASASELALSDDHSGIVEVDPPAKAGDDFAETLLLNDAIIDIENKMFTHRPDCFGILGVAREMSGIYHKSFSSPKWYLNSITPQGERSKLPFKVDNQIPKLVPRFMAQVIEGIEVKPSSVLTQSFLSRVGIRPINNIVDVTNFVMYVTGQPLHAYDYDKLPGPNLGTKLSKKGEKLNLLNGKQITLDSDEIILITSGGKPVGIGGVMGGADTEVDENTKNIVLECANFDMYAIRRASMALGLFTDAVTRFNKGPSPLQNDKVLAWATQLVHKMAGGKAGAVVDKHATLNAPAPVRVGASFINERLGLSLSSSQIAKLLENVEFKVQSIGKQIAVTPPFWRTDIEVAEDVVEEVGRLYGYDHIALNLPHRSIEPVTKNSRLESNNLVRTKLSKAGANEVLSYTFVHGDLMDKTGQDKDLAYSLSNAISPDLQYYRMTLTPSLLDKVHANIKAGFSEFAFFEIGKLHLKGVMDPKESNVPQEDEHLALVVAAGDKAELTKSGAAYYQAKRYLNHLKPGLADNLVPLKDFDFKGDKWAQQLAAPYNPERSGVIVEDNLMLGIVGEFSASAARALKLPAFSAGFELSTDLLRGLEEPSYTALPKYPKTYADISLRVPAQHTYKELYDFAKEHLEVPEHTWYKLEPIDIYQKNNQFKQFTFRVTMASYQKTMQIEEVNKVLDALAEQAKSALNVERL